MDMGAPIGCATRGISFTPLTVIVLAGDRATETNPFRTRRAFLEVAGKSLIAHALERVAKLPNRKRTIVVANDVGQLRNNPTVHAAINQLNLPVDFAEGRASPVGSLAELKKVFGELGPSLILTVDTPHFDCDSVKGFVDDALRQADADIVVAMVNGIQPRAAGRIRKPTLLRFRDGAFKGANLFLIRNAVGWGALERWQCMESDRKQPWRMARTLGFSTLIRYVLGQLRMSDAFLAVTKLVEARVAPVVLVDPAFGIDIDTPDDLACINSYSNRFPELISGGAESNRHK